MKFKLPNKYTKQVDKMMKEGTMPALGSQDDVLQKMIKGSKMGMLAYFPETKEETHIEWSVKHELDNLSFADSNMLCVSASNGETNVDFIFGIQDNKVLMAVASKPEDEKFADIARFHLQNGRMAESAVDYVINNFA